jgi:lipoprotein-anchoring transpeptidase ErfK/SrfK
MKKVFAYIAMVFVLLLGAGTAEARVVAKVNVAQQKMVVTVNGKIKHVWNVSTGKRGFITPRGTYAPKHMAKKYYSKKYYNSPMPYSIFFKGGYAVHGTNALSKLGAPASHGCIRLATGNAARLFSLVQQHGRGAARIVIT